ncbi:MAG: thermonuclease family protein [Pseudomonadota bacterium]|nr:thermonuclease family protein [Pseudomonadota bacterium]
MSYVLKARWKAAARWVAALALATGAAAHAQPGPVSWAAQVQYVVDGDSLWVRPLDGGRRVKLRLRGMDAPELCQPGGLQAQAALRALAQGQAVQVKVLARDRWGRAIAQVHRHSDGLDMAAHLVAQGWAVSEGQGGRRGVYWREQQQAQAGKRGMFADGGTPESPAAFRRRHGPCR